MKKIISANLGLPPFSGSSYSILCHLCHAGVALAQCLLHGDLISNLTLVSILCIFDIINLLQVNGVHMHSCCQI